MYYQNEPRFNGVYSRDNLRYKIKDEVEHIPKEIKKFINNKIIIANIFKHMIQ